MASEKFINIVGGYNELKSDYTNNTACRKYCDNSSRSVFLGKNHQEEQEKVKDSCVTFP